MKDYVNNLDKTRNIRKEELHRKNYLRQTFKLIFLKINSK